MCRSDIDTNLTSVSGILNIEAHSYSLVNSVTRANIKAMLCNE